MSATRALPSPISVAVPLQSWCRFAVIAFCVLVGTASVITGFMPLGANPLVQPSPAPAEKAKKA